MSLRELILAVEDLPSEDVVVPEWDTIVRVRALTAAEGEAFGNEVTGKKVKGSIMARLLVRVCQDPETGERLFEDSDVDALGDKSSAAVQRLFAVAQRLSALGDGAAAELEGN